MTTLTITAETDAAALVGGTFVDDRWGTIEVLTADRYDLYDIQGVMAGAKFLSRGYPEVDHFGIVCFPNGTTLGMV